MDLPMYEQYLAFLHDQLRMQLAKYNSDVETDYNNPWCFHSRNQNMHKVNYDVFCGNEKPFWQPWLEMQEDASVGKSAKQLPTTKWKRDRRTRPDYMRKSDPKIDSHESNGTDKSSSTSSTSSSASMSPLSASPTSKNKRNGVSGSEKVDAPLDMTTTQRQRGLPPSYSQAISDPSFRSTYTNSRPITNGRDDLPSGGISMCDPIIDEHFRRSLGKDYNTVFNNNAKENPLKPSKPPIVLPSITPSEREREREPVTPPIVELSKTKSSTPRSSPPVTSVIEMMDASGMSVDDHFAKALGDTWHKLNKKDSNHSENNVVVSPVITSAPEVVST